VRGWHDASCARSVWELYWVSGHVVLVAQARLLVVMVVVPNITSEPGALASYWVLESQVAMVAQTRFELEVGDTETYCEESQVRYGRHWVSDVAVAAFFSNWLVVHGLTSVHSRLLETVGDLLSYCFVPNAPTRSQALRTSHTLSLVRVEAVFKYSEELSQIVTPLHTGPLPSSVRLPLSAYCPLGQFS